MLKFKNSLRAFPLLFSLICFYGCAGFHSVIAVPSVSLDRGNFRYVRYVEAEETAIYVFLIGGMSSKSRNTNAYNQMVKKAQLQPNQAIVNVSLRTNRHLYFPFGAIVTSVTTIASGWVVEFTDGENASTNNFGTNNNNVSVTNTPINVTQGGSGYVLTILVKDGEHMSISAAEYDSRSSKENKVKVAFGIIETQISIDNPEKKFARTNLASLKVFMDNIQCDYGAKRIILLEQKLDELNL